jgi:hypothetical protein
MEIPHLDGTHSAEASWDWHRTIRT